MRLASISVRLALKRVSEAHKCETSFSWCEVGLNKCESVLIGCTFVAQKTLKIPTFACKNVKNNIVGIFVATFLNTGFILKI